MFAKTTNVGFAQRVVATLAACAVLLWSLGAYHNAQAANLAVVSDTLSTSEPGVAASHTIEFTVPTSSPGIAGGNNITITFDAQQAADGTAGQDFGGIDAINDNTNLLYSVNGGVAAAPTWVASDADSLTINGIVAGATDIVEIIVASAAGLTNPGTVDSYEILIQVANADNDQGRTRVAIVDTVLVTAIVDTVFDFTINNTATGTAINGTTTTGFGGTTTLDFGKLVAWEIETLAQRLNVTTNAINGFVVTVETDQQLLSSTGADIDGFADGGYDDTPALWTQPTNGLLLENEWGHWGITTEDGDLQGAGTDFSASANRWVSASTTPRAIFAHNGPSDGSTQTADATGDDVGQTDVGFQIQITPLQEAADDYNATLTYIATPTF